MERPLYHHPGLATYAVIEQQSTGLFRRLQCGASVMIRVLQGRKWLRQGDKTAEIKAGQVLLLNKGALIDVQNTPPDEAPYQAELLAFDPALLSSQSSQLPESQALFSVVEDTTLDRVMLSAKDTLAQAADLPQGVLQHRLAEPLVWLAAQGYSFTDLTTTTLRQKVRDLIASDLTGDWKAPAVAARLNMSEATLRRRLRDEETSFTEVLTDLRMTTALELLQVTDQPITTIAQDVGYSSSSRFAVRFRSRFGLSPSDIRQKNPQVDRISTTVDRLRTA